MGQDFPTIAKGAFDGLAREFGLSASQADATEMRYENDRVVLSIQYDSARSFEIDARLFRKPDADAGFGISIVEMLPAEVCSRGGLMADTEPKLASALGELARLTREYASELLSGNDLAFRRARSDADRRNSAYAIERDLRAARNEAEAAWSRHDYERVVGALESMIEHLSPAELKRLEYSRKHLGGNR